MSSLNSVILIGNLGRDPELRYLPSGDALCTFSIATSQKTKNKNGEPVEYTDWHNIVVWSKQGENCAQYLSKGSKVAIQGQIRNEEYEKNGEKRRATKIHANRVTFLDAKGQGGQTQEPYNPAQTEQAPAEESPF